MIGLGQNGQVHIVILGGQKGGAQVVIGLYSKAPVLHFLVELSCRGWNVFLLAGGVGQTPGEFPA